VGCPSRSPRRGSSPTPHATTSPRRRSLYRSPICSPRWPPTPRTTRASSVHLNSCRPSPCPLPPTRLLPVRNGDCARKRPGASSAKGGAADLAREQGPGIPAGLHCWLRRRHSAPASALATAGRPGRERRLLYVGMTRAQQRLILTAAQRRTLAGRTVENRPCPFLDDLPADLLATSRAAPRRRKARQLSLLKF